MEHPLSGIRVIDMGHDWACPHTARLLADYGAEVIKIEHYRRLDGMRGGCKEHQAYNKHPRFWQLNRNKLSLALDLKDAKDKTTFRELVKISDVIIENSRPGVLSRLGFSHDVLESLNPQLILVSMSAYGSGGPESSYAGYGGSIEAVSGIQSLTGYNENGSRRRIREMDVTNGIMGAVAVLTALVQRQHSGKGDAIDLSQMETATHGLIGEHVLEYRVNNKAPQPLGNRHRDYAPQGCYPCLGEDKWVAFTIKNQLQWLALCSIIDYPDLQNDSRFNTARVRQENHDELDQIIIAWTMHHPHTKAMEVLQNAGIPAGAVLNVTEICNNPHLKQRGYFIAETNNTTLSFPGLPFRLSNGNGNINTRGPDLGQHNQYVLCSLLGQSIDTVKPLKEEDIGTYFDT